MRVRFLSFLAVAALGQASAALAEEIPTPRSKPSVDRTVGDLHILNPWCVAVVAAETVMCHESMPADALVGRVTVIDGDTIRLRDHTIRLYGIDAPELDQSCHRQTTGAEWPCGSKAAERLRQVIEGRSVICNELGSDRDGPLIALCFNARGYDLAAEVVASGLAWADRRNTDDYAWTEDRARERGVGIWDGDNSPSWDPEN